ncbi:hypothetical protein HPHPP62_0143 [Helicobacter pylori Hp P-62]|nr:hypothetical protein HPHPP62_0143 [Helicobacter pylori Hp P-62]
MRKASDFLITRSYGVRGFSFGFEEGVKAQNTPLFSYKFKQT